MSLSILKVEKWDVSVFDFIKVGLRALRWAFKNKKEYDVILLEYWIDRPREMEFLLSIVKPDISVLTKMDSVHSMQFGDPRAIAEEEVLLNKNTKDIVYLNSDDEYAQQLAWMLSVDHFFYRTSIHENHIDNHIDFMNSELIYENKQLVSRFEAVLNGKKIWVQTSTIERQNYGYIAVGLSIADVILYKMNSSSVMDLIIDNSKKNPLTLNYMLQPWRFTILDGVYDSILVDSSYNCAPHSIRKSVESVYRMQRDAFPDHKIIVVFWDMRELGDFEEKEHRLVVPFLDRSADHLVLVGQAVKHTVDELRKFGVADVKFDHVVTSRQATDIIKAYLKKHDGHKYIILFKGSQNTIFLEETVKWLLKNEEDVKKLGRQSKSWMKVKEEFFGKH